MSADTWARLAQRQLQGMAAHARLAEALQLLGQLGMADGQWSHFLSEARAYAATRRSQAGATGTALPETAIQPPQLGALTDPVACAEAWLDWETATVAEYQRLHVEAGDDGMCARRALDLASDASQEAYRARRLLARMEE